VDKCLGKHSRVSQPIEAIAPLVERADNSSATQGMHHL
jgi:hypothetical protein